VRIVDLKLMKRGLKLERKEESRLTIEMKVKMQIDERQVLKN
jgi:hypothetical protein